MRTCMYNAGFDCWILNVSYKTETKQFDHFFMVCFVISSEFTEEPKSVAHIHKKFHALDATADMQRNTDLQALISSAP